MQDNSIAGQWINTKTGEVVVATSMIDNGDNADVMTNKGVIPMTEFMNYVKMENEDINPSSVGVPQQSIVNDSLISSEDKSLLANVMKPTPQNVDKLHKPFSKPQEKPKKNVSENYTIIDKLFTKFGGISIEVSIDWGSFPKEQLDTLIDIFDVPKIEIAEYISKNYANFDNISKTIENSL